MPALLPPLRLTGATVLRDGALQERSLGVAGGGSRAGRFRRLRCRAA
jgi:hypothetical protein